MRVGILTDQVPFIRGGAEAHADSLCQALRDRGCEAEIISVPFSWYPPQLIPDQIVACQLLDIEESCGVRIDRTIGLKFPAYTVPHANKVMWVLHQHRSAYDLWNRVPGDLHPHPSGKEVAKLIRDVDLVALPQARRIYANSKTVADRLSSFCGIDSIPLYHPPPQAEQFAWIEDGDFLLSPGRINALKRQDLVVRASALLQTPVKIVFIGAADERAYNQRLRALPESSSDRIHWLGQVSSAEKLKLYGSCLGVLATPLDEDYGYVALEAMLSSKPVLTCTDSGGPLEFVVPGETGTICAPDPQSLAEAMDALWRDRARSRLQGKRGRARYDGLGLSWDHVVTTLLA